MYKETDSFLIGITDSGSILDWKIRFTEAMSAYGVILYADGNVCYNRDVAPNLVRASYRFVEAQDARAQYSDVSQFVAPLECEFVGAVQGYFEWEPTFVDENNEGVASAALREAKGRIMRLSDQKVADAVVCKSMPLARSVGKSGFEDGGLLLSRNDPQSDPYNAYVYSQLRYCAEDAGFEAGIYWMQSQHNPFRWGYLKHDGKELLLDDVTGEPSYQLIKGLNANIWVYNLELLETDFFAGSHVIE